MFLRQLGINQQTQALQCVGGYNCPAVLELDSGDWAIIGEDITAAAVGQLPAGSGCGPSERIVRVPRELLIRARADIPATV